MLFLYYMTPADQQLLDSTFAAFATLLDRNYQPGFGIFPSSDPQSNYFDQVWTRDAAHATAHYFARAKPEAVIDSLRTILAHQRPDGALPSRVERQYQMVRLTPGFRRLSRPLFYLIEKKLHGRAERPVHEGTDSAGGEDTIPAVLIMAGELFDAALDDRSAAYDAGAQEFIKENFAKLKRAAEFFRAVKTDPDDGLAVATNDNPDWADTIKRKGKLGVINIWWWRGLRHMETIAGAIGESDSAAQYRAESEKVRRAIMEKLYAGTFFRAKAGEDRLDTVASIFGAGYFLTAGDAWRVERTLKQRVGHGSGLQNFDPPYSPHDIYWAHRWMGQWIYHNTFVWPWVTLQNLHLKIKIAQEHDDAAIREQYKAEAVDDLIKAARLFKTAGGAYEVFEPDAPRRGETRWYHPPQNFMGTMAAYQGAYTHLKTLGWI
jgi:hypothetical protein